MNSSAVAQKAERRGHGVEQRMRRTYNPEGGGNTRSTLRLNSLLRLRHEN